VYCVYLKEKCNELMKELENVKEGNDQLDKRISEQTRAEYNLIANVERQSSSPEYDGIMKFESENIDKIIQKLIVGMTVKTSEKLFRGFPAYILFMCIRFVAFVLSNHLY